MMDPSLSPLSPDARVFDHYFCFTVIFCARGCAIHAHGDWEEMDDARRFMPQTFRKNSMGIVLTDAKPFADELRNPTPPAQNH
jgi:hypothetical protein